MGSNGSFTKVLTISLSFSITNLERVVRPWRPHSVTDGVVLWDEISIECNLGCRQTPSQNDNSPQCKVNCSRAVSVSILSLTLNNPIDLWDLILSDWRLDDRREGLSKIKMESRHVQSRMSSVWSIGKPSSGKDVSASQLLRNHKFTSDL